MANYGGAATEILAEISRPGLFSKIAERSLVNNSPFYFMIAGEYQGEMKSKVKPAMQEETNVGAGYFENFIMFKENGNITWRSRTEGLPTAEIDLGDRPKVAVQNIVGSIPLWQRDIDLNTANPDRLQDLIKLALQQAKDTANNLMGVGAYALGTGFAGKELWGMRYWLPDTVSTGSVAGISQADEANWRSYSNNAGTASFATYARAYMETMFLETAFNGDYTDFVSMDNTSFGRLKALIVANERYISYSDKLRQAGFPQALEFSGRAVIADPNNPLGSIFAICSKKTKLLVVKGCSFNIGKFIEPVNEQYIAAKLVARLNLAFLTRRPSGKIYGFTTA